MINQIILELVENAAVLLTVALLFDIAIVRWHKSDQILRQIVMGIVLGSIGIVLMSTPWIFAPGIIFDTRSVLLGISGLFFGTIPTLTAMAVTSAFRIFQGGAAAFTGVSVILVTGSLGLLWNRLNKTPLEKLTFQRFLVFGFVIHVVMLGLMFTMPLETAQRVVSAIALPVLTIYPVSTALLGIILRDRLRRELIGEKLKENEERLRLAIASSNIGFFDRNFQTDKVVRSKEWKNILGFSADDFLDDQEEWQLRIHPDDLEHVTKKIEDCVQEKSSDYEVEYRLRHRDGSYRWVLTRGVIHADNNSHKRLIGCMLDITKQKEDEEKIIASESRFRRLAESSQDYIMLYDRECRHVYMNPSGMTVSGLQESDVIGKTHREAGFDKQLSDVWEGDIQKVFQTSQPTQRIFEWESANGTLTLDWRLTPVFDGYGKVDLVLAISRDITEMRRIEKEIQDSESNFRTFFETIGDIITVADEQGNILFGNKAVFDKLGYSLDELLQMTIQDLHPVEKRQEAVEIVQAMLRGERSNCTLPLQTKDGSLIPVETRIWQGRWNGRNCLFGISKDLTSELEAQQIFESLFRNNPNLMAVSTIHDRKFIDVNNAFLRKLGYSREDVIGKTIQELGVFPQTDVQNAVRDKLAANGKIQNVELKVKTKNGQFLDGLFSGETIETKGELCFLTVMVDITERKQADELMQSAQEELQRLLHEAEQSRRALLSLAEDQKIAEDALVKLSQDLIFAYDATLEGWSNALELCERETAGHSQRVVELTVELARSFGIDEETLKHMERGALLHDIGKMGIPDSILLKPGPLTDEEWIIMRQHPIYSYRLLAGIPYLQPALDIPYCHHERWDGSGYPRRLKGEEIPLAARIFALIDVWDALSSDRPYRPAWTVDAILNYLKEQSGKHFDPEVVEKFLTLVTSPIVINH